jgi:hypothetical protein
VLFSDNEGARVRDRFERRGRFVCYVLLSLMTRGAHEMGKGLREEGALFATYCCSLMTRGALVRDRFERRGRMLRFAVL